MDNNVRKRVYDVLLSKTGYKDSFEDFNKFMDTDNGAREKVYGVLRDKTGYKDSLEDFNEFMGGGLKDDAVSPQRRPSLGEQVNKPQFPAMEELPWMNNTKDRNDALYYTNESEKRIANSFKKGDFEPFSHKEEDTRINEQYTAKKVGNESDIIENARNRFALTERGVELDNELSTIQEEKTNKYLEEFKKSKEYQEMAGKQIRTREEADVTNKAINDLFVQRYGETINKEMQPYNDAYRNEVFSRYGVGIKDDLTKLGKKNTSNQVVDLTQEVNFMLDKHHESLKQHGGSGNNAMNALMGSTQYNQATGEQRRDIGALESAHRLLERSQEIINEAGKKGNTNFVEGLGRGLRDNFDADKWTMGLAEMTDAKYLNNALEKSERGEPLTPIEEKLLEASTINMVTQAYFSSDLGRGYKAGQVTAESLPFMMEFIVNPISGSGNAIAKGLLKYGLKKFGSVAASKGANIAGRLIGNSAAALGMEGTTGVGHVAAGTLDRLNQNYETSFDDNGEVQVDKVGNMGLGEAFARSGASRFFENQSEMIFNAFRGGSKVAKEAVASVAPGMSGKTVNKLVDFYDKIRNNKTFQSVTDRAQFHGILEEYGEEVYNNIANVAIGEISLEDATDIDSNIDTFLGLAPTSLAFTALGIGGLVHENTKAKNRLRKFVSELDKDSRAIFDELWTEVEKGNNDIAKEFVKKTLGDNSFTPEQKKERVFSVKDMINARDTEQVVNEADGTEEVADVADEAASAPIDKVNVYRDFVRAGRKAKQVLPEEIISQLPSVTDVESFIAEKNLNDVQKEAANAYSNAFGLFSEYQGDVLKRRQEVANTTREQAIDDVERIANQDTGGVVQVKHKFLDNPVYLVGGRLAFGEDGLLDIENSDDRVYYLDEDGNRKMAPAHDFDSVLSDDMKEDVIGMRLQDADQQFIQEEEASLSTPDIPAPERGDRVVINGDTYLIEEQDVDVPGGVLAVKLDANGAIDVNNGRQISLSADEYYSAKEAELWGENKTASETEDVQEKKVLDDGRLIIPLASSENEVAYNVLDRNGNTLDSGSMSLDDFNALKPFVEEREEDLNDDGTLVNPLQADNVLRNEVENDSATLNEESNVPQGEEVLEENAPSIPSDEKGNVLYHRVPVEVTIDAINREELEPDEIDSFVGANKESSAKLVSSLESKPPKMGTSIAKYKADKLAWSDKLSDAKAQVDYWNSVSEEIAASRVQPGDRTAEEIRSMGEPLTGEELAAAMLGTGRLPVLYDSYKKETGGRNAEARGMVGLFVSKANGGMTIEEAGEQLMLADQENGTNFFDPNDPNAGRNAIIDVLSGARTRGDLSGYIQRNREQMAERERQAEYDAYSSWTEDNFGMTPEDYEAYEEQAPVSIAERFKDFDEEDFYNNIANELNEEQREVAGVTESSEVLQGEGIVSPERIETSNNEGGTVPVGSESNSENGALLEETPTELNETPIPAYNKEGVEEAIPESEMSTEEEIVQVENGDKVIEAAQETLSNIAEEREKVNQSPTEAQKEAGNYQKGHVKIGRYNISIENSKGSERSGVDSNGQAWSITMNNDYGYIRGTESVDGDHIDIFLSDLPDQGSVFVVDQVKEDGSFDEHKVMYGFSSVDEARDAYLANYSLGWKGLGTITEVSKEDFNKWIDSSKRKTKAFAEYKAIRENANSKDTAVDNNIRFREASDVGEPALKWNSTNEELNNEKPDGNEGNEKLTVNNVNQKIYDISGSHLSKLYKNGSLGRVLVGDHADINQIKASREYNSVRENLVPLRRKLEEMIPHCTDAARKEVENTISDIDYALDYYKRLYEGEDVWRSAARPRFRILDEQSNTSTEEGGDVVAKVGELAGSLHTPVRVARTISDVPDGVAKRAIEKGRNIKGWYDTKTGEVVVYLPNTVSIADAQATILHEVVAHKGLRDMLGKETFEELCGKVFDALPDDIRNGLLEKHGDRLIAGDEYMASIAESDIEPSLWRKIKSFVRDAFRKMGVDLSMSDNDIRYLLWKSKNRLMKSDNGMDLISKVAADENMKESFHIGEYSHMKDEVEYISSNYGNKEYRMFNTNVSPDDLMELSTYLEEEVSLQNVADYLNAPETLAVYIRGIDKIYIFANKMSGISRTGIEKIFFHENIHASLNDLYGDNGRRTIVNLFYDKAGKDLDKYKDKVSKSYEEHSLKEEFFTWRLHEAMSSGNFREFTSVLDEYGMNTIDEILKNIGYDREQEENERYGRGRILGNVHGERIQSEGIPQQGNDKENQDEFREDRGSRSAGAGRSDGGNTERENYGTEEEGVRFREGESGGASDAMREDYEREILGLHSRISSLEKKVAKLNDQEDLRRAVTEFIRKEVDSKLVGYLDKKDLNSLLIQAQNAKSNKSLEKIVMNVKNVVLNAQRRKMQRMIDKLLSLQVQDVNGKNMSVAKNVDDSTRRIFSFLRGKVSNLALSGFEDDMKSLRRSIRDKHQEVARLNNLLGTTKQEDDKLNFSAQVTSLTAEIEELKLKLKSVQDEAKAVKEHILNTGDVDVDAEMERLNEKMDNAAMEKDVWTQGDTERMAALNILQGVVANKKHDSEIESVEIDKQKLILNNSDLYRKRIGKNETERRVLTEQINENHRRIVAYDRLVNDIRSTQVKQMEMTVEELNELISNGKNSLMRRKEEEMKRKRELISGAIRSIEKNKIDIFDDKAQKERMFKKFFSAPLGSFEYMCKRVCTKSFGKDGFLYKRFISGDNGVMKAYDAYVLGMKEFRDGLNSKCEELFGRNFEKIAALSDKTVNESGVYIMQSEDEQVAGYGVKYQLPLNKGQAMYIYQVWKMNDGRTKLELQGFDEESISQIIDFMGPEYVRFADWVQDDFLKDLREKYNSKYVEIFNTSLADIDNYIPLKIRKEAVQQNSSLSEDGKKRKTLEEKAGSLINRTANTKPVDITYSGFDVLMEHGNQMEEWNAYARVRKDLDYILSCTTFRNQLNANTRGSYDNFYDAAEVATKAHHPDSAKYGDEILGKLSKGIVGGNIAFRLNTALKQVLSAPAFLGYSQSPLYIANLAKNSIKPYSDFKWCMKNIPSFYERVKSGTIGNEKLDEKGFSKVLDKYIKTGMIPNKMVDAITCSLGAKSIYDYKVSQLKKAGVSESEAHNQALVEADIYYNATQQSSHPAFLSPMQMSRTFTDRMLTTYQNSNIGYVRKMMAAFYDLTRSLKWKELNQSYTDMYIKEGVSEVEAERKAYRRLLNENRKNVVELALFGWGLNLLWNIGSQGLLGFFRGDGGDDEDKLTKDLAFVLTSPVKGVPGGNLLESIASGYGMNPFLVYDELDKFMKESSTAIDEHGLISPELAYITLAKTSRYAGIDLEVWGNIYLGVEGMARDGALSNDKLIDLMYILNAPKSSRATVAKDLYKNEPILDYAEKVARAYKYIPKKNSWENWVPGAKPLTKQKENKVKKEAERMQMTPEERKNADKVEKRKKHFRKLKELSDDPEAKQRYTEKYKVEIAP